MVLCYDSLRKIILSSTLSCEILHYQTGFLSPLVLVLGCVLSICESSSRVSFRVKVASWRAPGGCPCQGQAERKGWPSPWKGLHSRCVTLASCGLIAGCAAVGATEGVAKVPIFLSVGDLPLAVTSLVFNYANAELSGPLTGSGGCATLSGGSWDCLPFLKGGPQPREPQRRGNTPTATRGAVKGTLMWRSPLQRLIPQ